MKHSLSREELSTKSRPKSSNLLAAPAASKPANAQRPNADSILNSFLGLGLGENSTSTIPQPQQPYAFQSEQNYAEPEATFSSFAGAGPSTEEEIYEQLGLEIQRVASAPPAMELTTNTIFSFQSKYSHLFGDIRCEDDYADFYQTYDDKSKLPPPLERDSLFTNWNQHVERVQNTGVPQAPPTEVTFNIPPPQQPLSLVHRQNGNIGGHTIAKPKPIATKTKFYLDDFSPATPTTNGKPTVTIQDLERAAADITGQDDEEEPERWQVVPPRAASKSPNLPLQNPTAVQQPPIRRPSPQPQQPTPQPQKAPSFASVAATKPVVTPQKNPPPPAVVTSPALSATDSTSSDESNTNQKESPSGKKGYKYQHISEVIGKIYSLAKDQFGCRFLQKKLEGEDPQDVQAIFSEVYEHIVELMTDPFGNYLCQKLLEHCNDKQKASIITAVSSALVRISMNMHGTRAVQKLIECLSTPQHIQKITEALRNSVVSLIKDLNGNHVIQRCLNKLSANDKQFIYDAVAGRCVEVATHKHGCCVLQRCIDFASEDQKMLLIREITANALSLVQNAFGNYVVQYVLDLGIDEVNTAIIDKFSGHMCGLSQNKFSSNVMEKCLRIANLKTRSVLIDELTQADIITQLLQDNYGNYVLQTAMTICDAKQFAAFNEVIRPMLHLVRNTPYGKKIESKLNKRPAARNGAAPTTPAPKSANGAGKTKK